MKIDPNSPAKPGWEEPLLGRGPAARAAETESMAFEDLARLEARLEETDISRADAVARAKALIASQDYPSSEALGGVAALLAKELQKHPEPQ